MHWNATTLCECKLRNASVAAGLWRVDHDCWQQTRPEVVDRTTWSLGTLGPSRPVKLMVSLHPNIHLSVATLVVHQYLLCRRHVSYGHTTCDMCNNQSRQSCRHTCRSLSRPDVWNLGFQCQVRDSTSQCVFQVDSPYICLEHLCLFPHLLS